MSNRLAKTAAINQEAVIYLGPSLPNGLLKNASMFYNGVLPIYVEEIANNDKNVAYFLVPVSKIAEIKNKLRDKASIDYARFVKIVETYKGAN